MHIRKIINYMVMVTMLFAGIVFARALAHAAIEQSNPEQVTGIAQTASIATGQSKPKFPLNHPAKIKIPSIKVDASIQQVGITAQGNIGAPSSFNDAGWYAYGPVPGAPGDAIIDGHYDNGLGLAGVFKNVSSLKEGDDVYIVTYGGTRLHFVVSSVDIYDHDKVPKERLFSDKSAVDKISTITLITCAGTWLPVGKTYDKRVFVKAVLKK